MKLLFLLLFLVGCGCNVEVEKEATQIAAVAAQEFIDKYSAAEDIKEEIIEKPKYTLKVNNSRFNAGDCIYGSAGLNDDNYPDSDNGYKVVSVDKDRNQYLLRCLTSKECIGGLHTHWISVFDKFMLKVECEEMEKKTY